MPNESLGTLQRSNMHRLVYIVTTLLLLTSIASAQEVEQYRYFKLYEDENPEKALLQEEEQSAQTLWQHAPYHRTLFDQNSVVLNHYRGVGYYERSDYFGAIRLPKLSRGSAMCLNLHATESQQGTLATQYTLDTLFTQITNVAVSLATRNYRLGVTASATNIIAQGWVLSSDIALRSGTDAHVKGVFTNAATVNLALHGRINQKSDILLALLFSPSERGHRKASTAQAFALVGDNYYNPSWGYQSSKIRNANTISSVAPTALLSYNRKFSDKQHLNLSLATTVGSSGYSGLDWLNGSTPLPDNYRYLPDYFTDSITADAVREAWQRGDSRYTQINFDELHRRNRLQESAIYLINQRVTRTSNLQVAATISHALSQSLKVNYGLRAEIDRERNFKRVNDLLSGGEFEDIDFFLVDDDAQSNMLQNNLNTAGRTVGKRDRYGYDYAINDISAMCFASVDYLRKNLHLAAWATLGNSTIFRRGYFRKELFADNSYGRSKVLNFADWSASVAAQYYPHKNHLLAASVMAQSAPADGENLFLQSQYNNRTVDRPVSTTLLAAEFRYEAHLGEFSLYTNLFARYHTRQTEVAHIYYDVASEFADVITSDLSIVAMGAELEARYNLDKHWHFALGATVGRYRYAGKPTVTVYADRDNRLLATDTLQSVGALRTGKSPEMSLFAEAGYYNRGWSATITGQYHAMRYATPSLLRRTESVLSHTTSDIERQSLMKQESLPSAFSLDLKLSKSIYLNRFDRRIYNATTATRFIDRYPRSKITIFVAINNLLGSNDIIYRAYETSRIRKRYHWENFTATPFPNYYLYAYPRTYLLQIRFSF